MTVNWIQLGSIVIFLVVAIGTPAVHAETITLKTGEVIEGKIIERNDEYIKIEPGNGYQVTYWLDEIAPDSPGQDEPTPEVLTEPLTEPDYDLYVGSLPDGEYVVQNVIDGDTILILTDDGRRAEVDLADIDAPDMVDDGEHIKKLMEEGNDPSALSRTIVKARAFLDQIGLKGKKVRIEFTKNQNTDGGRFAGYAYVRKTNAEWRNKNFVTLLTHCYSGIQGNEVFLNGSMIRAGYAEPARVVQRPEYTDLFRVQFNRVMQNGRGLWNVYEKEEVDLCYVNVDNPINVQKSYFPNGNLKRKAFLKNGKPHGLVRHFWENGNIAEESEYVNGQKQGRERKYYEQGYLKSERYYKDGKYYGPSVEYFVTGQIKSETKDVNSTIGLPDKEYYKTGRLKREIVYRGGPESAVSRLFYPDGKLKMECDAKSKTDWECTQWDENGKVIPDARAENDAGEKSGENLQSMLVKNTPKKDRSLSMQLVTKNKLQSMAFAVRKYWQINKAYPRSELDLTRGDKPYFPSKICRTTWNGFYYECRFTNSGFTIIATPTNVEEYGNEKYLIKKECIVETSPVQ